MMAQPLEGVPHKQRLAMALMERARRIKQRETLNTRMEALRAERARQHAAGQPVQFAPYTSLVLDPDSPYHDLQRASDWKIYYGGRDSAKSWAFAEELVRRCVTQPLLILCTREFQTSIADSVHRLIKNTITRLGLDIWFDVTEKTIRSKCGAAFIFKGLNHNSVEIKSTEGVDICWVEEAHNTSDDSWQTLIPTIRKAGSEIWASFNVSDEESPTHKRLVTLEPPNSIRHFVNYDVNPFLSERSKREIEYLKEIDYDAFEHVYLGRPLVLSDAIIFGDRYREYGFDDELATHAERQFYGADFGYARDPATLIHSFVIDNVLYIQHEAYRHKVELDDYGDFYDTVPGARSWPIKGDNARPETISHIAGMGFNITAAEKWAGSVEDGISHIRGFKEIVIHPRCKHTLQEAKLYAFKKDKMTGEVLPIIIDKHNHCWDAVRYSLDGYIQDRGGLGVWARLGAAG